MARPVKKPPEQWRSEILDAAKQLFLSKGYEETAVSDIMELAGGAKGMFYRFFQSKEEAMQALGDRMFFGNDPFEAVRNRPDLNGLEKIREVLSQDRADTEREEIAAQAVPILKDPRILQAAVQANRRVLTPLWLELIEEGISDGSIRTEYAKELSELLPLVNFWILPSVFPASPQEILHKCRFVAEVLAAFGLPVIEEEMYSRTERLLGNAGEENPRDAQAETGTEAPTSAQEGAAHED